MPVHPLNPSPRVRLIAPTLDPLKRFALEQLVDDLADLPVHRLLRMHRQLSRGSPSHPTPRLRIAD